MRTSGRPLSLARRPDCRCWHRCPCRSSPLPAVLPVLPLPVLPVLPLPVLPVLPVLIMLPVAALPMGLTFDSSSFEPQARATNMPKKTGPTCPKRIRETSRCGARPVHQNHHAGECSITYSDRSYGEEAEFWQLSTVRVRVYLSSPARPRAGRRLALIYERWTALSPTLRPYQREAIDAILEARRAGVRRLLVCLPTGAGKTVIFSHLAQLARRQVLVLAHREELLSQARAEARAGVAGHGGGGARTRCRARRGRRQGAGVFDSFLHEQRLAALIRARKCRAGDLRRVSPRRRRGQPCACCASSAFSSRIGQAPCSASRPPHARGDGKGLDEVFERIVYSRTLPDLIDAGYLAKLRGFRISTAADLTRLSASGADFREEELACVVDIEERNALVARSIQELAREPAHDCFLRDRQPRPQSLSRAQRPGRAGGHRAWRPASRAARAGAGRVSRGHDAGAVQRRSADRGLRRSRCVVHRDGSTPRARRACTHSASGVARG